MVCPRVDHHALNTCVHCRCEGETIVASGALQRFGYPLLRSVRSTPTGAARDWGRNLSKTWSGSRGQPALAV